MTESATTAGEYEFSAKRELVEDGFVRGTSLQPQSSLRDVPEYKIFALRYASRELPRNTVYLGRLADPYDSVCLCSRLFLIVGGGRTIAMNVGPDLDPADPMPELGPDNLNNLLQNVGIAAASITDVIFASLRRASTQIVGTFPTAKLHLQNRELSFARSDLMSEEHPALGAGYDQAAVRSLETGAVRSRLILHDGNVEIAPGLQIYRLGGYSPGAVVLRIWTARRGWSVLGAGLVPSYECLNDGRPYSIFTDLREVFDGYRCCRRLATFSDGIIASQDPLLAQMHAAQGTDREEACLRLEDRPLEDRVVAPKNYVI